ncbi:uncharacterized protein [Struthio camelus]|uniref:uncharacterized protein n=1 Tax=Struthio camelus TaxID=8801 RepID=UPI0036040728
MTETGPSAVAQRQKGPKAAHRGELPPRPAQGLAAPFRRPPRAAVGQSGGRNGLLSGRRTEIFKNLLETLRHISFKKALPLFSLNWITCIMRVSPVAMWKENPSKYEFFHAALRQALTSFTLPPQSHSQRNPPGPAAHRSLKREVEEVGRVQKNETIKQHPPCGTLPRSGCSSDNSIKPRTPSVLPCRRDTLERELMRRKAEKGDLQDTVQCEK